MTQPLPLHSFWPLQEWFSPLHSALPLHSLTPEHLICSAVAGSPPPPMSSPPAAAGSSVAAGVVDSLALSPPPPHANRAATAPARTVPLLNRFISSASLYPVARSFLRDRRRYTPPRRTRNSPTPRLPSISNLRFPTHSVTPG